MFSYTQSSGAQSYFDNPGNLKAAAIAVPVVSLAISTTTMAVHMIARRRSSGSVLKKDFMLILTWSLFSGGVCTTVALSGSLPPEVHSWDLNVNDLDRLMLANLFIELDYSLVLVLLKIHIILEIQRLFYPHRKATSWSAASILIVMVGGFFLGTTIAQPAICLPISKVWQRSDADSHRQAIKDLTAAVAWFNLLSDVLIILLPQLSIWNLFMSPLKKARVSISMLLIGILASACAAARLGLFYECTDNVTYYGILSGLLMWPEVAIGFVIASMPTLAPFFRQLRGRKSHSRSSSAESISKTLSSSKRRWDDEASIDSDYGSTSANLRFGATFHPGIDCGTNEPDNDPSSDKIVIEPAPSNGSSATNGDSNKTFAEQMILPGTISPELQV